jgi:hypothetical protein
MVIRADDAFHKNYRFDRYSLLHIQPDVQLDPKENPMRIPSWRIWAYSGTATLIALALNACGGGGAGTPAPSSLAAQAGASAIAVPTSTAASDYTKAIAGAKQAAATDPLCAASAMGDFYWEIGDAAGTTPIASNSQGGGTVTASSNFNIASASKFIFGAYVLEKKGIDAVRSDPSLFAGLRFLSGYTGFSEDACAGTATVGGCYTAGGATQVDSNTVGKFDYDGGHDQRLAAYDLGLGSDTARQLDQEYQATLGLSSGFHMAGLDPIIAGGLFASATDYAQFLRRVMNQQLVIGRHLGDDAVCADPWTCPTHVAYSPIVALREPWKYSYNHWVESQDGKVIDAYSSPGKWGFYPWLTPDRKYYGIVSRHDTSPDSYAVSVKCGRQIRKAFLAAL